MHSTNTPVEKAHPAIAPLLRTHKLTPMEYRAKWLKAGVLVLRRVERHLVEHPNLFFESDVERMCIAQAVRDCQMRRSRLAAELEGWKY